MADAAADKDKGNDPDLEAPKSFKPAAPDGRGNFVQHMIAKHGTPERVIEVLGDENVGYRERHNEDQQLVTRLQERLKGAPKVATGAKVLTPEEAKDYEAYLALGKPADLKKVVEDGATATKELTGIREREQIDIAAKSAGYNSALLSDIVRDKKLKLTLVERTVEGEKKKVAMVQPEGSTDAPVELTLYVDEKLLIYKPALEASEGSGAEEITKFPKQEGGRQGSSGRLTAKDTVNTYAKSKYSVPGQKSEKSA